MIKRFIVVIALLVVAAPLSAQVKKNVISANPFGLLLELANAEFEHAISETATVGVGGSTFKDSGDRYVNADVFYRYYPNGNAPEGWAFGGKVGLTNLEGGNTKFGYGFDVNRSWILGKNNNFYVGLGFGLKKLVGSDDAEFDLEYLPTIRLINIGYAF